MITRHESHPERAGIWARIAAPLPTGAISWRQDGRPVARDGKYSARFVAFIDAQTVRERLDLTVPGEWDLTLEMLPGTADDDGVAECAFKARLQVLGVIREDVGQGRDYKTAATDAFKRAAMRFGIGHELYDYEQNWVQVDGDGKYAKPLEDPAVAYARRMAKGEGATPQATAPRAASTAMSGEATPAPSSPLATDEASCPKCSGRMWDNRISKRNPKAPDWKCRSRSCDGVVWPPKEGEKQPYPMRNPAMDDAPPPDDNDFPQALHDEPDSLPF